MARVAVLSDVHGNLPALLAVADDLAQRDVDLIVNLGDHASGPLWPGKTVAFLLERSWVQIAGNCDRQLVGSAPEIHGPSDRFAFERLTSEQKGWLDSLPPTRRLPNGLYLCHGTPENDSSYLLEAVRGGHAHLAEPSDVAGRIEGVEAEVMLCGHSHVPRVVRSGGPLWSILEAWACRPTPTRIRSRT